jgi:predicted dithiol-disulfide oxidoreductase (DUF899 family)
MRKPPIVTAQEWETARQRLLAKEKELTRARDALAACRLNARNTTLVFASRASQPDIARLKERMGWTMPWYTMADGSGAWFDADFGVDEWHGTNAFIRDGDRVFRSYFINSRGDEALGTTWSYLDMTALGRQEEWEESPDGYPQTPPYGWWNWHDEYSEADEPPRGWLAQVHRDPATKE